MALLDILIPSADFIAGEHSGGDDVANASGHVVAASTINFSEYMEFDISPHSLTDGWLSTSVRATSDQDANREIVLLSGPTSDLFRIVCVDTVTSGGSQKAQYWNGSSWVDIGTLSTNLTSSSTYRLDVHWNIADSGGEFTVYVNGASEATMSGDTKFTSDTTVDTLRFTSVTNGSEFTYVFPFMIADADSRALVMLSIQPNSNGFYTTLTGSETSVDDYLFGSSYTSTYAVGDADGEKLTLNFPDLSAYGYTGYAVRGVALAFAAKAQSEPGLYIKPLTRKSSTDYAPTGSFQPGSVAVEHFAYTMLNDPATGAAWSDQAAVDDTEFGIEMSTTA